MHICEGARIRQGGGRDDNNRIGGSKKYIYKIGKFIFKKLKRTYTVCSTTSNVGFLWMAEFIYVKS